MIKLKLFLFIIICNYSFSQSIDLTKSNIETLFQKENKWFTSNTDSSYFVNNSIWLHNYPQEIENELYVWKFQNKREIGFYSFNQIIAVSSPMRIGYKYKAYNQDSKLFLEIKHKREIIERFEVKQIIHSQTNDDYKILIFRVNGYNTIYSK